jgi:DNA primase
MSSPLIEQILKTRKITEYLSKKGIEADSRLPNGRYKYLCPIHEEKTPSFYVYTNAAYENFFCFGCKARYNIIHLYSYLEKVTIGQAIRALADGIEVDINAEISQAITAIENDTSISKQYNSIHLALECGRLLYEFLKRVDQDPDCLQAADKIGHIIDKAVEENNIKGLKILSDSLTDVLIKKIKTYDEEKEKRILLANASSE